MKSIYLLRHAKSSWKYPKLDDFERPLNKRGRKNAPLMGTVLSQNGVAVDLIVASPANRAAMTARVVAAHIQYALEDIFYTEDLYHAGTGDLLAIIAQLPEAVDRVMLVGHNPGLTQLANRIGDQPVGNVPTAAVYGVALDTSSWEAAASQSGHTTLFEYPKKYA